MIDLDNLIFSAFNFIIICGVFVMIILLIMPHQTGITFGRLEKEGPFCKSIDENEQAYNYDYYKCIPSSSGMGCMYNDEIYMKSFFIMNDPCIPSTAGSIFVTLEDLTYRVTTDYHLPTEPFLVDESNNCIEKNYKPIVLNDKKPILDSSHKYVHVIKKKCKNISGTKINMCTLNTGSKVYNEGDFVCLVTHAS